MEQISVELFFRTIFVLGPWIDRSMNLDRFDLELG
jgi:hypothetical protein